MDVIHMTWIDSYDPEESRTACGRRLGDVRRTKLYKSVTCEECLRYMAYPRPGVRKVAVMQRQVDPVAEGWT
jgi:hypothetical protein